MINRRSSSDSDEFFDAEGFTNPEETTSELKNDGVCDSEGFLLPQTSNILSLVPKCQNIIERRKQFKELRRLMQTDDDELEGDYIGGGGLESETSSVDEVFASATGANRMVPFRVIEQDSISIQSLTSLGRVGRLLSATTENAQLHKDDTTSLNSVECASAQAKPHDDQSGNLVSLSHEPDVVTSAKISAQNFARNMANHESEPPVPPPRLRRKNKCTPISTDHTLGNRRAASDCALNSQLTASDCLGTGHGTATTASDCALVRTASDCLGTGHGTATTASDCALASQQTAYNCLQTSHGTASDCALASKLTASDCLPNSHGTVSDCAIATLENVSDEAFTSEGTAFNRMFANHDQDCATLASACDETSDKNASSINARDNLAAEDNVAKCESLPKTSELKSTTESNDENNLKLKKKSDGTFDIRFVSKGQYVVKPQDNQESKGENSLRGELSSLHEKSATFGIGNRTYPQCSSPMCNAGMTSRTSRTYPLVAASSHSLRSAISPRATGDSPERRRSTGDERIKMDRRIPATSSSSSNKAMSDMEILEKVTVLNLDTGEQVPLSIAEDKLPQCVNPLSLHIMRLTSEYVSNSSIHKRNGSEYSADSDDESIYTAATSPDDNYQDNVSIYKRSSRIRKLFGKTVRTARNIASIRRYAPGLNTVDEATGSSSTNEPEVNEPFKLRASSSNKGPYEFNNAQHVQDMCGEHSGPIWCMKFSLCGRLLATAGQDRVLRIWVVRSAYRYFQDMQTKYNGTKCSPTPSQESLSSLRDNPDESLLTDESTPFISKPFSVYAGHTSDLLDVAWSRSYFILSSSMDRTVRLWHISRRECLCCFQHIDFVTAICFHPKDDRFFLSGSLDGKIRLWNIPDKKVAVWNELDGGNNLITAANFCQNGKFAVIGSYDGRCIFYNTEQLRYHTQIHVRSTRGKNSKGRKITGIEPMPGEDTKILVTSNDSRVRLYDLLDLNLVCKYKGFVNVGSQIKASFSHDGKFIISGSENQCVYLWKTRLEYAKFTSVRRDRNDFWEGIKAHSAVVTCAIFTPNPGIILEIIDEAKKIEDSNFDNPKSLQNMAPKREPALSGYVIVSADFSGCVRVFMSEAKPKQSSLPIRR